MHDGKSKKLLVAINACCACLCVYQNVLRLQKIESTHTLLQKKTLQTDYEGALELLFTLKCGLIMARRLPNPLGFFIVIKITQRHSYKLIGGK